MVWKGRFCGVIVSFQDKLLCVFYRKCVENSFDKYTERIAFPLSTLLTTEANASKSMNKSTGENMSSEPALVKNQSVRLSTLAKDAVTGKVIEVVLYKLEISVLIIN